MTFPGDTVLPMAQEAHAVLDDGLHVMFRPIRPSDKDILQFGFERLSPESRYKRFFRAIDRLSDAQLRYLTEVDFENHFAWVAFAPDDPGSPGIGVVRWIRVADAPDVAEGAVTVIDDYHNRGVGKALLWLGARSAIEHGIRAIRVNALSDNAPVIQLLKDFGGMPGRWESGVLEVEIPIPATLEEMDASPVAHVFRATARGEIEGVHEGPGGLATLTTSSK